MFTRQVTLFKIRGIPIRLDYSWFIIAFLLVWSLSTGLFPSVYPGMPQGVYWAMGLIGALGLFGSILLHELGHALTAIRYGLRMRSITLFIFGGVAELEDESPSPKAELLIAIAGPIVSVVLAAGAYAVALGCQAWGLHGSVIGVFSYLAGVNAILVAFNMLPAFPLDGGRVLRAILWRWKRDLKWATRTTSRIGSGFGTAFIVLGLFSMFSGNFVGGLWWGLIGFFLRHAAAMSYQQLLLRLALEGEPIERFMQPQVVTVPPDTSIQDFVDRYLYRYHHQMFPVAANGDLDGYVTVKDIKAIPKDEWPMHRVGEVMESFDSDLIVGPDSDAMHALSRMSRGPQGRMIVMDHGRLVGIITLKDIMKFLSLKMELEEGESHPPPLVQVA